MPNIVLDFVVILLVKMSFERLVLSDLKNITDPTVFCTLDSSPTVQSQQICRWCSGPLLNPPAGLHRQEWSILAGSLPRYCFWAYAADPSRPAHEHSTKTASSLMNGAHSSHMTPPPHSHHTDTHFLSCTYFWLHTQFFSTYVAHIILKFYSIYHIV